MSTSKIHPLWFIAAGGLITWYAWGLPDNKIGLICAAFITAWPFVIRASDWLARKLPTQGPGPRYTREEWEAIREMENEYPGTRDWNNGGLGWD